MKVQKLCSPSPIAGASGVHFVFLYETLSGLGGTEVLIARMSDWLVCHGHEVTLLVESDGEERRLLNKSVNVVVLGADFKKLGLSAAAKRIWKRLGLRRPNVIKSVNSYGAWCATTLAAQFSPRPKAIHGFYYPTFEAPVKLFGRWPIRLFTRNIMENIGKRGALFLSESQLENFRAVFGADAGGVIWPLPLDRERFATMTRNPQWGRIVSIGRLSSMKEYNLYMLNVIKNLVAKGLDVSWVVYGDGPYLNQMADTASRLGIRERVHFMGRLAYDRLGEALETAYAFVGMGTAMLEAAASRVPGPVAIAYDESGLTYGPLYNLPFGNIGDRMRNPPVLSVESELERILRLNATEYQSEMDKTRAAVKEYDIDDRMSQFMKIVTDAPQPRRKPTLTMLHWFYYHYRRIHRGVTEQLV